MLFANLCLILVILWALLAYKSIPLPFSDAFFAWLNRQWLFEGVAGLTSLGFFGAVVASWRRRHLPHIPWWSAWGVWFLWVSISLTYSIDRGVSLRAWLALGSYGLLAMLTCLSIHSLDGFRLWTRFLAWVAIAVSLQGLIQYRTTALDDTLVLMERLQKAGQLDMHGWGGEVIKDFLVRKRIFSVFGWPNLFAGFLLLMLPLVIGLAVSAQRAWSRIGWLVAGGLLGLCLILTLSMVVWIAAVFTSLMAWWLLQRPPPLADGRVRGGSRTMVVRLTVLGCVVSLGICVGSFMLAKRARPFILGSFKSRVVYVQGAWNVLKAHPLVGTGVGTFGLAYRSLMPLERVEGEHAALHAHNTPFELAAELGLVGTLLFGLFLWSVGALIVQSTRSLQQEENALTPVLQGLAIGVMGFFLHSLLEQTFFEGNTAPFWWILLGVLTGGISVGSSDSPQAERPAQRRAMMALPAVVGGVICVIVVRLAIADCWAARAAFLDLAGKSKEALTAFDRAQAWDALASRYPLEEGERLFKRSAGRSKEETHALLMQARAQYERTVKLSPWLGYAWLRLAEVRWQLGQGDQAVSAMHQAVERDPNSRTAVIQLTRMLYTSQQFEVLRPIAQRLQQLEPANPEGLFSEALAWQGLHRPDQAQRVYQALVKQLPSFYPAWFNLAELLRQEGNQQEATAAYKRFLEVAPAEQAATRVAAQAFLSPQHSSGDGARKAP